MAYPVAVIQMDVQPEAGASNRATALRLAAQAVAGGARLVLLPQYCITDLYRGAERTAQPVPGALTEEFARIAGAATVALPLLQRVDERVYGACALVTGAGLSGVARQTHLYSEPGGWDTFADGEVIAAGDELAVFECGGVRVGVALGFDAEFPEVFRTLTLAGAEIILVSLNTVRPDHSYFSAMARRNQTPLLLANRLGFRRAYPERPEYSAAFLPLLQQPDGSFVMRCKGGSLIMGSNGEVLARGESHLEEGMAPGTELAASLEQEEILTASLPLEEIGLRRQSSPYLTQRRKDLYTL